MNEWHWSQKLDHSHIKGLSVHCHILFCHVLICITDLCASPSVLLQPALFLCLTLVVRIQMQSILNHPTGKLSPKHLPAVTFSFHYHSAACCCRWHPSAVCPSPSPPSRPLLSFLNLSLLPFSCHLHLSFHQSSQRGLLRWNRGRLGNMAAIPVYLHPPPCFPAAVFVLWQLVATFWPQRVHSAEYASAHMQNALSTHKKKKNGSANMRRLEHIRIHMDAQANTQTDRPVYTDISTHTNTYTTHKHSTLLFYQVSLCLAASGGFRLSEQ